MDRETERGADIDRRNGKIADDGTGRRAKSIAVWDSISRDTSISRDASISRGASISRDASISREVTTTAWTQAKACIHSSAGQQQPRR